MDLSHYFTHSNGAVLFTEEQGSAFAKGVAGDFNPIHDPGSKRFCVPGDLLFCVMLNHYGLARTSAVQFSGMLDAKTPMVLPQITDNRVHIQDARDRAVLSLFLDGENISHAAFISALSEAYVQFSGKTFPDILVPLMQSANVMIHPERPLVIYKDMAIELNKEWQFPFAADEHVTDLNLQMSDTDISVTGRKGAVRLRFAIRLGDVTIGTGEKNMVLSGLREFDDAAMQSIVDQYNRWREQYASAAIDA